MRKMASTKAGGPSSSTAWSNSSTDAMARPLPPNHRCSGRRSAMTSVRISTTTPPLPSRVGTHGHGHGALPPLHCLLLFFRHELEPIETMGRERQQVRQLTYPGEALPPKKLYRVHTLVVVQV